MKKRIAKKLIQISIDNTNSLDNILREMEDELPKAELTRWKKQIGKIMAEYYFEILMKIPKNCKDQLPIELMNQTER